MNIDRAINPQNYHYTILFPPPLNEKYRVKNNYMNNYKQNKYTILLIDK